MIEYFKYKKNLYTEQIFIKVHERHFSILYFKCKYKGKINRLK